MSLSPSPSPRKRAYTVESATRAWNVSTAHIPTDRPLSALRSPNKTTTSPSSSHMARTPSPKPKFDLNTTIPKSPSPVRTIRGSPKKEIHEYEVPIFDFSMRGNTVQKPPALRRKPLMATAGQAASHALPMAKTQGGSPDVPDKSFVVKATIVAESAVGLRVKQAHEVPFLVSPMPALSSRMLGRLKQLAPESVPLSESPVPVMSSCEASRLQQAPESVSLPASPMPATPLCVPTTPTMRVSHMRVSSEASQRSVASLQKLSPGTKKHVAPQLLDKANKPPPKATPTGPQARKKERQAAKFTPDQSGEKQSAKSAIDGRGLGLSPTKAAKPPSVHIGPAKTSMAVGGGSSQPHTPSDRSPKIERQTVHGEVFLVSSKPKTLQTKLRVSPRTGAARVETPKSTTPKAMGQTMGQTMGHFYKPIDFGIVRSGKLQVYSPKNRDVSDSTSAAADDERGTISSHRPKLGREISESEAHVLAVDPRIGNRRPSSRRLNCVSDSVVSNSPKHIESIDSQAKQYVAHTLSKNSLLAVDDDFQKELTKSPLVNSSPIVKKKVGDAVEEAEYQAMLKKVSEAAEEAAYQAMIKKAYIDERPKLPINTRRPRSRHRHGSSRQTQVGASESRDRSSSEFSIDFLRADASQEIILETFTKLNKFGGSPMERTEPLRQLSPVREPVSPSKKTKLADGGNFSWRMSETRLHSAREPVSPSKKTKLPGGGNLVWRKGVSPSKRVDALELELPVMPSHDLGFHFSSDHPMSPLKHKGKESVVPFTPSIVDADPVTHFDEVGLDDEDAIEVERVYQVTSMEELDKRPAELEEVIHDSMKNLHRYEVDNHFVDKPAELAFKDALSQKSHILQAQVENDCNREMAKIINAADCATATTTTTLNKNTALHQKSSMSSHQSSSIASVKSVRWHPSIDSVRSVDSPVVQEKAADEVDEKVSLFGASEKKSAAELELQSLFVPNDVDLAVDEAHELALFARTLKAKKGGQHSKFLELLRDLRKEIEQDILNEPDKVLEGVDNVPKVHLRDVVAATPAPKWNPTVPEFTPRDVKENEAWVVDQDLKRQRIDMAMSVDDIDAWSKPTVQSDAASNNPAILSASPRKKAGSQNLFHDPAILSVSPGRIKAMRGDDIGYEFREPFMSENFVDALFTSASAGDPAIVSIGHSPTRRHYATSHQTAATAAVPVPGTTATQSVRKRVIWDNPCEPGGREAIILSKKYSEECLEQFRHKYPLTGLKAKVLPKKKLEDLPKKYEEEVLLGVVGGLKPRKLATEAADIQQKLELLLLKKKETKVKKIRESSGSGAAWGLSSVRGTLKSEAV